MTGIFRLALVNNFLFLQTAAATTSEEATSSEARAPPESETTTALPAATVAKKSNMCTQSVQTTPQPLSVSEQRLALRKHVISKSTIRDVIQLEQVSAVFNVLVKL